VPSTPLHRDIRSCSAAFFLFIRTFDIVSLVRFGNVREICFRVSVVILGMSTRESFVRVCVIVVEAKQVEMKSGGASKGSVGGEGWGGGGGGGGG
jgi:hypothetical protein